ncbi:hypothetical protein VCRA2122O10_100052 [Vibrio crassostreae]|nr:hypothetical protein VCRA2122O10_100052 [Vibrio crassostreae]
MSLSSLNIALNVSAEWYLGSFALALTHKVPSRHNIIILVFIFLPSTSQDITLYDIWKNNV